MPNFDKGPNYITPFGPNEYLRSTQDKKTESYTFSKDGIPTVTIDGVAQKVLQRGTVLAKITSGPEAGKIGVFQRGTAGAAAVNEVQRVVVDATGGNWTAGFDGETTGNILATANAAAVQAALEAMSNVQPGDIVVTGGPGDAGGTTPYVFTFGGQYAGMNVPQIVATDVDLTGGAGTAVADTTTEGAPEGGYTGGAADGRDNPDNIVGLCDTFVPWTLMERDVEVAATYEASVVQAWCIEYNAAGAAVPMTNATRDAINGVAGVRFLFK